MESDDIRKKRSVSIYELVKESEKERENLPKKIEKKGRGLVSGMIYYGLPLISIGIFFGVIFAGTVPAVKNGILNRMDEIEQKKAEIQDLDRQIASLQELKSKEGQIDSDLKIIEKIVPSKKTEVAKFVGQIAELAKNNDLEETKYSSGEELQKLQEELEKKSDKNSAGILRIPAYSNYQSRFGNIEDFLNALYNKGDFIIVSGLEMQGGEARRFYAQQQKEEGLEVTYDTSLPTETWTMEVIFEKFQFSTGFNNYIQENLVPVDAVPDEKTLVYIRDRYT